LVWVVLQVCEGRESLCNAGFGWAGEIRRYREVALEVCTGAVGLATVEALD
jgi:hypothetical protein